jgi:excinuclease UvrABC nuclease subunit
MIGPYKGNYPYSKDSIEKNAPTQIGVYYCGHLKSANDLGTDYVGSSDDIRTRLLQHLDEDRWPDVTHFGFKLCSSRQEASNFEADEIRRLNPKYNKTGK